MSIEFTAGGHSLSVRDLRGEIRLSRLFSFEVRAFGESPPAVADLLGQPFDLVLGDTFEQSLPVHGVVLAVERSIEPSGHGVFTLELGPEVARAALGRNSRVFQDRSVVQIVDDVLASAGLPADRVRWSAAGTYPERPYCAQYNESDWDFVARLLAEEGLYFWFEFGDEGTVLVIGDDSTSAPELPGGAEMPFRDEGGLAATRDAVMRIGRTQRIATDAVRLRDYDPEKPRLTLDARAGGGPREVFDWPGRFRVPAEGDRLARVSLEALRAAASVTSGETSGTRLRPGLAFELSGHPVAALDGRYLVESVTYEARGGDEAAGREGFRAAWTAIPLATPFRAPRARVVEAPGGPQTGVVVCPPGEEIHADDAGRIRVQFYWDREGARDDKASTWMRVGQFALGGSMVIPRKGWDVLVGHHEGDIDAPVVIDHLYDGEHPVPYPLPANKTRTAWQTATTPEGGSSNEIRFEDKTGAEQLFINASKDMNVVIGDEKQEKVANNREHTITGEHQVQIGANAKSGVGQKQEVAIGGSETIQVGAERMVVVAGSESATIGGSRTVTALTGVKLAATGARSLTVGGTMTSVAAAEVSRAVLGSLAVTVGGSWINAAVTGLANMTLGAGAETVGGAKIHASGAGVSTNVKGALAETVGGAYVIAAGGNVAEGATGAHAITVGGALVANAPKVLVEADSEISIRVGAASLTITKSRIEVKAPSLASPGATIAKTAGQIHHN